MYLEPAFDASQTREQDGEPALTEQLGHFVRAARSAFSSNTERAVRSDLGIYAEWCAERGERALPAKAETVASFVDAMAEVRAPATVRRYLASIAVAHRALGCSKTISSPLVRLSLQRMHRRKGRRQGQAHAGLVFCPPSDQGEVIAALAISFSVWQCAGHGDAAGLGFVH